jgi:hypothetical protein
MNSSATPAKVSLCRAAASRRFCSRTSLALGESAERLARGLAGVGQADSRVLAEHGPRRLRRTRQPGHDDEAAAALVSDTHGQVGLYPVPHHQALAEGRRLQGFQAAVGQCYLAGGGGHRFGSSG